MPNPRDPTALGPIAEGSPTFESRVLLSQGDIFRILKRTIELLRSVAAVPYVSEEVKGCAAAALRAMDRYPLADNVLMGLVPAEAAGEAAASDEAEAAE